jgi:hypothetical protein
MGAVTGEAPLLERRMQHLEVTLQALRIVALEAEFFPFPGQRKRLGRSGSSMAGVASLGNGCMEALLEELVER